MARDFYPFVEQEGSTLDDAVRYPARIAVYDDAAAAPRVVVVEPKDVRSYLEEITATVNRLEREQGGPIPFMVVREIVENFVHAYFVAPTISILDGGNTIRFCDQGPGIKEKTRALEYGTTSATEEMRHYIRGVGSGLPYVQQYMQDKGWSLTIEDNVGHGTVVTLSTRPTGRGGAEGGAAAANEGIAQAGTEGRSQAGASDTAQQTPGALAQPQAPGTAAAPFPQAVAWAQAPGGAMGPYPQPWGPQQAWAQPWAQAGPWPAATWQQAGAAPVTQGSPAAAQQAAPLDGGQVPQAPLTQAQQPSSQMPPDVSERGLLVLSYLEQHATAGPSDLTRAFGKSAPTWSRELSALERAGAVRKQGQKYVLTTIGRTWAEASGPGRP